MDGPISGREHFYKPHSAADILGPAEYFCHRLRMQQRLLWRVSIMCEAYHDTIMARVDDACMVRDPDETILIMEGSYNMHDITVCRIELRRYIIRHDKLGTYSVITAHIHINDDTIEMRYDEGYRGDDALSRAAAFLRDMVGVSGLVLRARIALDAHKV